MVYLLGAYSEKLQKEFDQRQLKGKPIQEFVKIFGKPKSFEYLNSWIYNSTTLEPNTAEAHSYFKLTYYTNNPTLNFIGWFPCGGTRVFADKDNKLTGVKKYCY